MRNPTGLEVETGDIVEGKWKPLSFLVSAYIAVDESTAFDLRLVGNGRRIPEMRRRILGTELLH